MTTPSEDELLALAKKATPGPWSDCNPDCNCGQISCEHGPIAKVESGDWGDRWPSVRLVSNPNGMGMIAEPFMDMGVYGHIKPEVARGNAAYIAAANPAAIIALIERHRAERERLGGVNNTLIDDVNFQCARAEKAEAEVERLTRERDDVGTAIAASPAVYRDYGRPYVQIQFDQLAQAQDCRDLMQVLRDHGRKIRERAESAESALAAERERVGVLEAIARAARGIQPVSGDVVPGGQSRWHVPDDQLRPLLEAVETARAALAGKEPDNG